MDLQAKSPAGRAPVRSNTEPVSQPASPAFGDSQPGAVALRKLSDTMHDGPRMAAQRALAEAMQDNPRMIVQRMFAGTPQLMNGKEREFEEEEEEEEALPDTISFYHGTDLETAKALSRGIKIDARGKGEFGGGFYLTHDQYQAAHIGDYYTGKEERGPEWGVVEFAIPTIALQGSLKDKKVVMPEDFEEYYEQAQLIGNQVESEFDWTMGPIKDRKTPYIQHLFASGGLAMLNDDLIARKLVLSGDVGVDAVKYSEHLEGYDQMEDEMLGMLLNLELKEETEQEEFEEEEEEEEGADYDYLEERVALAKDVNETKLTRRVIKELEEALTFAPEDEKILAWLEELSKL